MAQMYACFVVTFVARATVKRIREDGGAVWNGDRGKRVAMAKRTIADAGDAVWNGDRVKRVAKVKRLIGNVGDVVWDDDVPVLVWLNPTLLSADERNHPQGDQKLKEVGFRHDGVVTTVKSNHGSTPT